MDEKYKDFIKIAPLSRDRKTGQQLFGLASSYNIIVGPIITGKRPRKIQLLNKKYYI